MSKECPYYHDDSGPWGYGRTCLIKQSRDESTRTVSDDWVHKYC